LQQAVGDFQDILADPPREKSIHQRLIAGAAGRANIEHERIVDAVIVIVLDVIASGISLHRFIQVLAILRCTP
jgi:hypothetical protein